MCLSVVARFIEVKKTRFCSDLFVSQTGSTWLSSLGRPLRHLDDNEWLAMIAS
jgi:hypothetical protein